MNELGSSKVAVDRGTLHEVWKSYPSNLASAKSMMNRFGYVFKDELILMEALTHRSAVSDYFLNTPKENRGSWSRLFWNERLEFLGDSVLGLSVSTKLWNIEEDSQEGVLSRFRAAIVSEPSLAAVARQIGLGPLIALGKGEYRGRGFDRDSLLADGLEALIGAVYLDSSFEVASQFVQEVFGPTIENRKALHRDFKTQLQESTQALGLGTPLYDVIGSQGPDHNKSFLVAAKLGSIVLGKGEGASKKRAAQFAAKQALRHINEKKIDLNRIGQEEGCR